MSNSMSIKSKFKNYNVQFVNDLESVIVLAKCKETFFVIDKIVYNLYKNQLPQFPKERLYLLDALESKKNMCTVLEICELMTNMRAKRNTHLVSIGGGITQDITGFVASSLYRGIKWTFYPTTLLAACDSCIGGKSSLNYKGFKNLLGSFYPPDEILIYPQVFKTLTSKDYCSGLGEVVKFSVIAGQDGINKIETDIEYILEHNYVKLVEYIKTSLKFKKWFIEKDEFDKDERILLNFAHTFGHAYEAVSNYEIPHGSAVVLGMITANNLSLQRGYITKEYAERIGKVCKKILHDININIDWFELDIIIKAIRKDKKQTDESITAILLDKDCTLKIFKNIKIDEIEKSVEKLIGFLNIK